MCVRAQDYFISHRVHRQTRKYLSNLVNQTNCLSECFSWDHKATVREPKASLEEKSLSHVISNHDREPVGRADHDLIGMELIGTTQEILASSSKTIEGFVI